MTLSQLALLYYKEGCRGHPVGESQSRRLFRDDLYFGNGKFKAIRVGFVFSFSDSFSDSFLFVFGFVFIRSSVG